MSNLPKYYFGDIPAGAMREIMDEMLRLKPEPSLAELEVADDYAPLLADWDHSS